MLFLIKQVFNIFNIRFFDKWFDYWYLVRCGIKTNPGEITLIGAPIINKYPGSKIVIGKGTTLISTSLGNPAGINHPVVIATMSDHASILIGDNCGISGASIVSVKNINIGKSVKLGANSNIYDTDFHVIDPIKRRKQKSILEADSLPVSIKDDVWVGAGSTILKGVNVSNGVVIGAGSIVTKNIGPNVIAAGNPARVIRHI
jgi:acetyltransferase-like isoleucine patch superfamily enzyme